MKKTQFAILGILMLSLLLQACDAATAAAIETGVAATQEIAALQTQLAEAQAGEGEAPENEAPAQEQEPGDPDVTPTVTYTPTPSTPQITVSQDTNCRTGPASYYDYVATAKTSDVMEVVGLPVENVDYVIVKDPTNSSRTCWLWTRYADKARLDFPSFDIELYQTPITPTPSTTPTKTPPPFDWSGTWTFYAVGGGGTDTYTVPVNVSGNTATATFNFGAETFNITGSLSNGGQNWSGTYTDAGGSNRTFQFQLKSGNTNQFVGNLDSGAIALCGSRGGASQPSPCLWP
jgi:hypothetical protein